ncbi:protein NDNF-like [Heptranchias perlo]|uniref:protein NDNF-like n=1 Tax=Heptranchias perlo TaxID=212740 RepID=UPI00355988C8
MVYNWGKLHPSLVPSLTSPSIGTVEWSLGVWVSGRLGLWASGSLGVWVSGRLGLEGLVKSLPEDSALASRDGVELGQELSGDCDFDSSLLALRNCCSHHRRTLSRDGHWTLSTAKRFDLETTASAFCFVVNWVNKTALKEFERSEHCVVDFLRKQDSFGPKHFAELLVEMSVCGICCSLLLYLTPILLCQAQSPAFVQQLRWEGGAGEAPYDYSPLLPDGREITVFLFRDLPQSRYFLVKEDKTPFSITVTPCDAPLEWRLAVQEMPEHLTWKSHSKNRSAHRPGKLQKLQRNPGATRELFTYKGIAVETYVRVLSHSAFYRLELISTEGDTQIRVYLTTHPEMEPPYPELPFDPRVDVTSVGQTTVTLAWKPSPSVLRYEGNIQYCLLVNQKHNYKSLCAAETQSELPDDLWPDLPVVSIYSKDQLIHLAGMEDLLLPSNVLSSPFSKEPESGVMQFCIGNKSVYAVSELQPNTQYYFDVFAVNVLTNTSSAFTGTFAKTLQRPDPNILELKEGIMIQVDVGKDGQKFYSFRPGTWHRKVQFTFYSCGEMHIQIERNGKLVASENVENLKHVQLKGKTRARYIVGIKSTGPSEASVKILVSTSPNKPLFPRLPDNLKLKTFDKLRTCNSVTIAWLGTREENKYCLYKREIEEEQVEKEIKKPNRCFGPERRKVSEKVHCKYFHNLKRLRAVTVEKVRGLRAGTTYLFDVYVIGHRGHSVKYQSKVVKTRKAC